MGLILAFASACEKSAWEDAKKFNTLESYQNYLEKYPEGKHSGPAKKQIIHLCFTDAQKKNTAEAYLDFISKFPDAGNKVKQARLYARNIVDSEVGLLAREDILKKTAVIETNLGVIKFRFFPDVAPDHCRNFIKLARMRFYDGLTFHQLMPPAEPKYAAETPWPDGVLLGGSPGGAPDGGPGYTIKAEFNERPHRKGTVSMYHMGHPNSAGSQFFICLADLPELDGKYTVFGQVTEGMDVLDAIAEVPSSGPPDFLPERELSIIKVTIQDME